MADNFQLPSLSLELYGDILETPYPFLFSAKELGETSQARGRALEGGEAVRRGGGEGRAGACRPGLKMERERQALSLGCGSFHRSQMPVLAPVGPVQTDTHWARPRPSSPTRPSTTENCPNAVSPRGWSREEPGTFTEGGTSPKHSSHWGCIQHTLKTSIMAQGPVYFMIIITAATLMIMIAVR